MERKNIFWGVLCLVGAVVLLADKLGVIEGVSFWTIFLTAICITVLVKSLIKRKFGRLLFAAAFLIIINDELLHMEAITPWPVLWAALFGTIGLKLLFPKSNANGNVPLLRIGNGDSVMDDYAWEGDEATYANVFGESVKYIVEEFSRISVTNVFGSTQVFFTDATLKNGSAQVSVGNVFGSVVLYVPSTWRVIIDTDGIFGSSGEKGRCSSSEDNVLRIVGNIVFGNVEIVYV